MNIYSSLKAAWHTEKIDQLRQGKDIVPTHIHLVISDLCNQDCHFCSYRISGGFASENFAENGNKNPARFIPTHKAKEILDDCARLGVKAIEFTGGGEPTVHSDCIAIIGHAQKLGLQTGLVTNGVRFKDDPIYRNLDWLRISLDAGTEQTYQTIRSSAMWPKAINAISLAGTFDKPAFGVGFVVTDENYKEIFKACSLAKTLYADYVRIGAMFSFEGSDYYAAIADEIVEQIEQAKSLETADFKIVDFFGNRLDDLKQGKPEYIFCGEQQFVLYIGGDQKVYTCCTNAYTTHGEIGNLKEQSFASWINNYRRYDFDARKCHHCQFNEKNRTINYLIGPKPPHVDFV